MTQTSRAEQSGGQRIESGYAEIGGAQLYYEATGAGHPVLLLHADVADRRMWDEQFATWARQYRVIRFDKRGFGKTTSPDGAFSPCDDILALLAHLGITRTYLVGLSNGGSLAVDFALEHPEMVDGLVVVAGGISGRQPSATADEMALVGAYMAAQERKDTEELVALAVQVWCDGPAQPEGRAVAPVRERVREMLTEHYRSHPEQLAPSDIEPPADARLEQLRVPTLVIEGAYDFSGTNAAMDALAERVPGATKVVFETAHMVNLEQPQRFDAQVLSFLAQIDATA